MSLKAGGDAMKLICHQWVQVSVKPYGSAETQPLPNGSRTKLSFIQNGAFERIGSANFTKVISSKGKWVFNYDHTKIGFQMRGTRGAITTDIEIIKLTTDSLILRHGSYYQKENKRSKVYVYDDSYFVRGR
ncbi:hypothetical protein [Mucilaginibacter myungsuensis]